MVVDDAEADRINLEQIISDKGISVISARNGKEALQKACAERPDMIFLDILMPDMDGFETCRVLRDVEAMKDIPVVIVSSKSNKADRIWAMEQGATAYLTKPYTPADIDGMLGRFH
ncbi:MAG: PleD family two-component system response regulator [Wenzhouxiangellaceae bacterium]